MQITHPQITSSALNKRHTTNTLNKLQMGSESERKTRQTGTSRYNSAKQVMSKKVYFIRELKCITPCQVK